MGRARGKAGYAVAGLVAFLAGPALAQSLVVRSSGPSASAYRPGQTLPRGWIIIMRPLDILVLLDGGRTRRLSGPQIFIVGSPVRPAQRATLSALSRQGSTNRRDRLAGVRRESTPGFRGSPSLWSVDYQAGGTVCFTDRHPLEFLRLRADRFEQFEITADGREPATIELRARTFTAPLPISASLRDGAELAFRRLDPDPESPGSWTIRMRRIPSPPRAASEEAAVNHLASQFLARGCTRQLFLVLSTLDGGEGLTAEEEAAIVEAARILPHP